MFWIAFEDVLKYFDCIDICKVRPGWNEVRVSGILPPMSSKIHQGCTLLTVLEPTEVEFTLFQEGQRNSERSQRYSFNLTQSKSVVLRVFLIPFHIVTKLGMI